jgi:hypothetical protein
MNVNGTFTYIPPKGFSGIDTFIYQAEDSHGQTYSATVTITVLPLVTPLTFDLSINTELTGNVLTNAIGTDLRVTAFQNPSTEGGIVVVNPDGSFTYNPPANFVGTDSFTYTVTDSSGNSVQSTVTIDVTGTPPPPPSQRPTLISIEPSFGPDTGGTLVFITGTNFIDGSTQVFFGETPASNVVVPTPNTLIATTPPGTGVVRVTIKTPFGHSPVISADRYTYIQTPPPPPPGKVLPPKHFQGTIKKYEFLNKTDYELKASWDASNSSDIAFYRIYHKGKLVKEVRATEPLKVSLHLKSKHARHYSITAVNVNGKESTPTKLRIKHG